MSAINIAGQTFARLTAIEPTARRAMEGSILWRCRCVCGKEAMVCTTQLRRGIVKSCGCLNRDSSGKSSITHGATRNKKRTAIYREYQVWVGMHRRCYERSDKRFHAYGGRGITVCESWRDFPTFLRDMGPRPPKYTIERIDNSRGYEPDNCKWATVAEQCRNRRSNIMLTIDGETMCMTDWANRVGMLPGTINSRLKRGWPAERAVKAPRRY